MEITQFNNICSEKKCMLATSINSVILVYVFPVNNIAESNKLPADIASLILG